MSLVFISGLISGGSVRGFAFCGLQPGWRLRTSFLNGNRYQVRISEPQYTDGQPSCGKHTFVPGLNEENWKD